jgi:hypothetical protein
MDWSVLRGAALFLTVSLVVVASGLTISYQFWDKQDTVLKRERARLVAARSQYHALDEEEDIIAAYLPRYATLESLGIIGQEQRLDWIEALRQTAREVDLPRLQYTIDAQRPFESGMSLDVGEYRVYASSMRLDFGLLHEGDLLRLLAGLREEVSGLFGVNGCRLTRSGDVLDGSLGASNLEALCVLNFITIRGPEAPAGARS